MSQETEPAIVRLAGRDYEAIAVKSPLDLPREIPTRAPVCIDIETNAEQMHTPEFEVRTVQFSSPLWGDKAYVIPAKIEWYGWMAKVLEAAPALMAHNAMVEHQGLALADITPGPDAYWHKTVDTMLAVACAGHPQGPSGDVRLGLKENTRALVDPEYDLDVERKEWFKQGWVETIDLGEYKSGPRKGQPKTRTKRHPWTWATCPIDAPEFIRYAAGDVIAPPLLFDAVSGVYRAAADHYKLARELSSILQRRIVRGIHIDEEALDRAEADLRDQIVEPVAQLRAAGIDVERGYTAENKAVLLKCLEDHGLKPSLSKDTQQPQLGKSDMVLAADGEENLPALFKAWYAKERAVKWQHAYLDVFRDGLENDGKIHPDIRVMQAATGRTSMANPPAQQMPTEGIIRPCMAAAPGKLLVGADLSQIEFRISGGLSGDRNLLKMVLEGTKIHNVVAKLAFGDSFTAKQYGASKVGVYAWLYGGTPKTIAKNTGLPLAMTKEIVKTIEAMFPDLVRLKRSRMGMDRATTWYGREILLNPDAPWGKLNYEIQGTAYDLFTLGTLAAAEVFGPDAIWLTVHDEVIVEVDEADAEEAAYALQECLTTNFMGVPCPAVGQVIGRNWSK